MDMKNIQEKLAARGLALPAPAAPVANYVPYMRSGAWLMISGQGPVAADGTEIIGLLGRDISVAQGQQAAALAALNILAQAQAACDGDLRQIKRCLKLNGFVACTDDFTEMPAVINGASDLLVELLGEAGKHTRAAVGAPSLPRGWAVEIDAIFELHQS